MAKQAIRALSRAFLISVAAAPAAALASARLQQSPGMLQRGRKLTWEYRPSGLLLSLKNPAKGLVTLHLLHAFEPASGNTLCASGALIWAFPLPVLKGSSLPWNITAHAVSTCATRHQASSQRPLVDVQQHASSVGSPS